MANINDRIGSQNVIRVLSNAAAPPTKLLNLTDVNAESRDSDGLILVWDVESETFVLTDTIDNSVLISDNTQSISTTTGALRVVGGLGVGGTITVGGGFNLIGILKVGSSSVEIDGDNDVITVGTGATISSTDGIYSQSLDIVNSIKGATLKITGVTTLGSTENTGITTVVGDLYVGQNFQVAGVSTFIGNATFKGGTIGIGDSAGDDVSVLGEFTSNLVPNTNDTVDIGTNTKKWRNSYFSGLTKTNTLEVESSSTFTGSIDANDGATIDNVQIGVNGDNEIDTSSGNLTLDSSEGSVIVDDKLSVTGVATFTDNVGLGTTNPTSKLYVDGTLDITGISSIRSNLYVTGITSVTEGLYYDDEFDGPNGIAYFDDTGKLVGASSTETGITTSNYVLVTNESGLPQWSTTIDGGEY